MGYVYAVAVSVGRAFEGMQKQGLAEGVGFEPTVGFHLRLISNQVP